MLKRIGVYCASSNHVDAVFVRAADDFGRRLAESGRTLIYGGGNVGLMGVLARSVHRNGGRVVGVIPGALKKIEGIAFDVADEMIVTATMQERKRLIFTRADAFVVLPGGFGTLEEFLEVLTLRKLSYHDKPIIVVNVSGFFDSLLSFFDELYDQRLATRRVRSLFSVVSGPEEAMAHLESTATAAGG